LITFQTKPQENLDSVEEEYVEQKKIKPLRIRVVSVLKEWIEKENEMFQTDQELRNQLLSFVNNVVKESIPSGAAQIEALLNQTPHSPNASKLRAEKPPNPILPKSLKYVSFDSIDSTEIARQVVTLCLLSTLFHLD